MTIRLVSRRQPQPPRRRRRILGARGETPLHRAALHGRAAVVEQLISAGATVDAADRNGCGPGRVFGSFWELLWRGDGRGSYIGSWFSCCALGCWVVFVLRTYPHFFASWRNLGIRNGQTSGRWVESTWSQMFTGFGTFGHFELDPTSFLWIETVDNSCMAWTMSRDILSEKTASWWNVMIFVVCCRHVFRVWKMETYRIPWLYALFLGGSCSCPAVRVASSAPEAWRRCMRRLWTATPPWSSSWSLRGPRWTRPTTTAVASEGFPGRFGSGSDEVTEGVRSWAGDFCAFALGYIEWYSYLLFRDPLLWSDGPLEIRV